MYRFERLEELIARTPCMDPPAAAAILRERKGLKDAPLGNGNELAINQLMAHHSIIFKPESRQVWISTPPYQLGDYIAYDLDEVFNDMKATDTVKSFMIDSLAIPASKLTRRRKLQACCETCTTSSPRLPRNGPWLPAT